MCQESDETLSMSFFPMFEKFKDFKGGNLALFTGFSAVTLCVCVVGREEGKKVACFGTTYGSGWDLSWLCSHKSLIADVDGLCERPRLAACKASSLIIVSLWFCCHSCVGGSPFGQIDKSGTCVLFGKYHLDMSLYRLLSIVWSFVDFMDATINFTYRPINIAMLLLSILRYWYLKQPLEGFLIPTWQVWILSSKLSISWI